MNTAWLLTNIISALLLPPLSFVILGVAGFMLRKHWPRVGAMLCIGSVLVLIVMSTVAGSRLLTAPLESLVTPFTAAQNTNAQAIVILGGGRLRNAPEYDGQDIPNTSVLARLRYAARLHRETGLPVMVTGGRPDGSSDSEAAIMARVLRTDFSTPVQWLEEASNNTAENAKFSAQLLHQAGVQRILLVTDAMHMPRSKMIFVHNGLQVIAAPTIFLSHPSLTPIDFVPAGNALAISHYAMHEWIGLCWYWIRHGVKKL